MIYRRTRVLWMLCGRVRFSFLISGVAQLQPFRVPLDSEQTAASIGADPQTGLWKQGMRLCVSGERVCVSV